jgi:hypothetical protein
MTFLLRGQFTRAPRPAEALCHSLAMGSDVLRAACPHDFARSRARPVTIGADRLVEIEPDAAPALA